MLTASVVPVRTIWDLGDGETERLEAPTDHPPGQVPWRDDFVAWRDRTRGG